MTSTSIITGKIKNGADLWLLLFFICDLHSRFSETKSTIKFQDIDTFFGPRVMFTLGFVSEVYEIYMKWSYVGSRKDFMRVYWTEKLLFWQLYAEVWCIFPESVYFSM